MALEKKISRKTTTTAENNENKENKFDTLVNEIESLKRTLDDKEETINDLALDRDQFKEEKEALDVKFKCTQRQFANATKRILELETERRNLIKETDGLKRKYDNALKQHADALRRIEHLENESTPQWEKVPNQEQ